MGCCGSGGQSAASRGYSTSAGGGHGGLSGTSSAERRLGEQSGNKQPEPEVSADLVRAVCYSRLTASARSLHCFLESALVC